MMRNLILSAAAAAMVAGTAVAQDAPAMDPATIEEQTAASSDGLVVPGLLLLMLLAAAMNGSGLKPPPCGASLVTFC